MKILDEIQLGFDDVVLLPNQISEIESRKEIVVKATIGNIELDTPIIASPMMDVCDGQMAAKMATLGGLGIIHRFNSVSEQLDEITNDLTDYGCAVGLNDITRFDELSWKDCELFCIDVANSANRNVEKAISKYVKMNSKARFIVGNVASPETYNLCSSWPQVVGVRCGISGGKACTTKGATGVNSPMISLLMKCREVKDKGRPNSPYPAIIADGGIRSPEDFCKALAAGADCVMLGSLIAATTESPAKLIKNDQGLFKEFSGSASFNVQSIYKDKPAYIEGRTILLPYRAESLEQLITRFMDGLRSSMSYFNARSLSEFRANAVFGVIK